MLRKAQEQKGEEYLGIQGKVPYPKLRCLG